MRVHVKRIAFRNVLRLMVVDLFSARPWMVKGRSYRDQSEGRTVQRSF